MRLFLYVLGFTVGMPVLILALTRLSYRVLPRSIEAALWRAFVWTAARVMAAAEQAAWGLCHHATRLCDRTPLWRVGCWLDNLATAIAPTRFHVTAVSVGRVCDPCAGKAPGWWEFDVDCAGHQCGTCEPCREDAILAACDAGSCEHHLCHFGEPGSYGECDESLDLDYGSDWVLAYDYPEYDADAAHYERFGRPMLPNER